MAFKFLQAWFSEVACPQLLVFSCSHPGCACGNALCWERQLHPAGSAMLHPLYIIPFLFNVMCMWM